MLTDKLKTLSSSPVWSHIGLDLQFAENGKSQVNLPVKHGFIQLHGTVHGGIIATLSDCSMAAAINSVLDENSTAVTVEMKINYLKPGKGNVLTGRGDVVKKGKTLTLCQSEIFDENDELIAFGLGTFFNQYK